MYDIYEWAVMEINENLGPFFLICLIRSSSSTSSSNWDVLLRKVQKVSAAKTDDPKNTLSPFPPLPIIIIIFLFFTEIVR